jgi:hypothetical protein
MKRAQKVTKLKLNIEQSNDFILLGLVCSEPDYKLSQSLNKKFGISLRNIPPLKLADQELTFSRFSNSQNPDNIVFNLIANRSGISYLLAKLKNIDYLLQISDPEGEADPNVITASLREVITITAVFNIDLNTVKDKNLHYLSE